MAYGLEARAWSRTNHNASKASASRQVRLILWSDEWSMGNVMRKGYEH